MVGGENQELPGGIIRGQPGMMLLLASVKDKNEALQALEGGADIIDMKNPAEGALGALPCRQVREIVQVIGGRRLLSATTGDLPMEPELIVNTVRDMADTGVDIVKIALFPSLSAGACITALSPLAMQGVKIVAVVFADIGMPDSFLFSALADAGFYGVMLDTANKNGKHLLDYLTCEEISVFLARAKSCGLKSGLAGSLQEHQAIELLPLSPDYLGFRTALCSNSLRLGNFDIKKLIKIKEVLHKCNTILSNELSIVN